jgi:hypothetical protein
MFDKVILSGGDSHHHTHHTTVTEKRAPTDESIKLLQEMQDRVLQDLLARDTLKACGIEAKLYILRDAMFGVKSIVLMKINGKEIKSEVMLDTWAEPVEQRVIKIRDALATTLANNLMHELFGSIQAATRATLEQVCK